MLAFIQGITLGFAMILPIGPQNAFVMMQGIRRQYHLMTPLICATSDMILLSAGIFGGGLLLSQSPLLLTIITGGGIIFLFWYGFGAFKSAWRIKMAADLPNKPNYSRRQIIITLLAVTWLNPHVYLDTVVVLGSVGSQFMGNERQLFALGAISASFIWFFALSILAASFANKLQKPLTQIIINLIVGLIMWGIAGQLARSLIS